MTDVTVRTPTGDIPAYVATPAGNGPWPAVVVVHDFAGMTQDLRNQANWLASEGFLAAAPDMYYWGTRLRCLRTVVRDLGAGQTLLLVFLARVSGTRYHEDATRDARRRIVSFFEAHLASSL